MQGAEGSGRAAGLSWQGTRCMVGSTACAKEKPQHGWQGVQCTGLPAQGAHAQLL